MADHLRRWLSDEGGQDLIEYMLLASFVAITGYLGMQIHWNRHEQQLSRAGIPPPRVRGKSRIRSPHRSHDVFQ